MLAYCLVLWISVFSVNSICNSPALAPPYAAHSNAYNNAKELRLMKLRAEFAGNDFDAADFYARE